jgi:isopenicillin N synthase-like dioxygenase
LIIGETTMKPTVPAQTIPVVQLSQFLSGNAAERAQFVQTMGRSLETLGFFALTDHGVDRALIQQAYAAAEAVFTLPAAVKRQYEHQNLNGQRGFTHFGREHAKDSPYPDLKEFWHIGRASAQPANLWPAEVPAFAAHFSALFDQLEACAQALLRACALYLDLPESFLSDQVIDSPTLLRVIHYPPIPLDTPTAHLRAAPHEDINLITLLCEATAPGLELLQANGTWLPIAAIPGQIIVDTGDMLQNLTNGRLKSTTHRVVNPDNDRDRRFSLPFFVHPRPEVDLTPLAHCVEATGGVPRYPRLNADTYLQQRLADIGLKH